MERRQGRQTERISSTVNSKKSTTCRRGTISVCPALTGYASAIARTSGSDSRIRSVATPQNGQRSSGLRIDGSFANLAKRLNVAVPGLWLSTIFTPAPPNTNSSGNQWFRRSFHIRRAYANVTSSILRIAGRLTRRRSDELPGRCSNELPFRLTPRGGASSLCVNGTVSCGRRGG